MYRMLQKLLLNKYYKRLVYKKKKKNQNLGWFTSSFVHRRSKNFSYVKYASEKNGKSSHKFTVIPSCQAPKNDQNEK